MKAITWLTGLGFASMLALPANAQETVQNLGGTPSSGPAARSRRLSCVETSLRLSRWQPLSPARDQSPQLARMSVGRWKVRLGCNGA
jgi:hypothetical protein